MSDPSRVMPDDSGEGLRILIADDDVTFRETAAVFLRRAGYLCTWAGDAEEAATALAAYPYELLITDINMPGNENLELLHRLHRGQTTVPVILVTGYPTVPTAVEALRLSVVDYFIKPLDFPSVLLRIRHAIEKGAFCAVCSSLAGRRVPGLAPWSVLNRGFSPLDQSVPRSSRHGQSIGA